MSKEAAKAAAQGVESKQTHMPRFLLYTGTIFEILLSF